MLGSSRVAAQLAPSQEGFNSMSVYFLDNALDEFEASTYQEMPLFPFGVTDKSWLNSLVLVLR
jgi:hypothetical protein